MKFLVLFCLIFILVDGGVVTKRTPASSTSKSSAENTELSKSESAELIEVDVTTTLSPSKKSSKEVKKEEKAPQKDHNHEKDHKHDHSHDHKDEKAQKSEDKTEKPVKQIFDKLQAEINKNVEDATSSPQPASKAPAPTTTKASKNSAVTNEKKLYIIFTSFLIFLFTAFL